MKLIIKNKSIRIAILVLVLNFVLMGFGLAAIFGELRKDYSARVEERIKSVSDTLTVNKVGIWKWDVKNGDLTWDDGMMKIYDTKPKDFKGLYSGWVDKVKPEFLEEVEKSLGDAVEHADVSYFALFELKTGKTVLAIGDIIYDDDGEPSVFVGINIEVSRKLFNQLRGV
jgi:hypothetical protein